MRVYTVLRANNVEIEKFSKKLRQKKKWNR
jgi:hypothetical protein